MDSDFQYEPYSTDFEPPSDGRSDRASRLGLSQQAQQESVHVPDQYTCPGESHPISRAIHLSRLASFYPKCTQCPHNCETGVLQPQLPTPKKQTKNLSTGETRLFQQEGVRGVYLNEMTRARAAEIAAAFASLIWRSKPLTGRIECEPSSVKSHVLKSHSAPQIVVGYDQRASAPDIVLGVTSSLRLMGCEVIVLGLSTKPCFMSAIAHLQADAGVLVTGAGSSTAKIGMDFFGQNGIPWSNPGKLQQLEEQSTLPNSRPRRQSPTQRQFHPFVPYEASLWKHFHALRPLTFCCASPAKLVLRTLNRLFEKLPVQLHTLELSIKPRDIFEQNESGVTQLCSLMEEQKADFGFFIDEDGMRCAALDENGELIPPQELTLMLAELLADPGRPFVLNGETSETLIATLRMLQLKVLTQSRTHESTSTVLHEQNGMMAGGSEGYYWYNDPTPSADAILTLAHLLQLLSRQTKPLSALRVGTI